MNFGFEKARCNEGHAKDDNGCFEGCIISLERLINGIVSKNKEEYKEF